MHIAPEMNNTDFTDADMLNITMDYKTINATYLDYIATSAAPVVKYQCDIYDLFMGFFVKVCNVSYL